MGRKGKVTEWREAVLSDLWRMDNDGLKEKYGLSVGLAVRWRKALEEGRSIHGRIDSFYRRTHARDIDIQPEEDSPAIKWVYMMIESLNGDTDAGELAREHGIRKTIIERWRHRIEHGDDMRTALGRYYRRNYMEDEEKRTYQTRETNSEQARTMLQGKRCVMCGVLFERDHERPVACRDCRKRRDFRPRMRRYGRTMEVVEAWHREVGI